MVSGQEISRTPLEPHYWMELLPGPAAVRASRTARRLHRRLALHRPARHHARLPGLPADQVRAGGRHAWRSRRSPPWPGWPAMAPVVVNCSGARAHDLVPDPAVVPVRGQVVIAANPGIEEFVIDRDPEPPWITYMFPHGDTILLGGTNDEGNWDQSRKTAIAERIVAGWPRSTLACAGRRSSGTASACGRAARRCGWNPSRSAAACCGTTTATAAPAFPCPGAAPPRSPRRVCAGALG